MFELGSATIGPFSLLNVEPPVVVPLPVIGSPTFAKVKPSSSDRCTCTVVLEPLSWYAIQTCEPRDVIHCRSACVVSITCFEQCPKSPETSALGHVTAETPSCVICATGLKKKIRLVRCSVP